MKKYLLGTASIFLALSCAKERGVDPVADVNENRFAKATLQSSDVWLTKATIVKTSAYGSLGFVGLQNDVKAGKWVFTKDSLKFVKAYNPETNDEVLDDVINSWDIDHSEYRLKESSGTVSNAEEENNRLPWNQKRFFKVNFGEAAIAPIAADAGCWKKVSQELIDDSQSITAKRISFEVDYTYELNVNSNSCL